MSTFRVSVQRQVYEKKLLYLYYIIFRNAVNVAKKMGVTIGNGCKILDNPFKVFGSEPWLVTLGNRVEITNGVQFITHDGAVWVLRQYDEYKDVDIINQIVIGDNVFIGAKSIILPGVKIGNNSIIGAGSIVTKDVPESSIYAGNPAKFIVTIDEYIVKNKHKFLKTKLLKPREKRKILLKLKKEGRL